MARVNFKPKTLPTFNLTGRYSLTLTRSGVGSYVKGKWVAGTPTSVHIECNVQPSKYHDVLKLAEAFRTKESKTIYSVSPLKAMREDDGVTGGVDGDTFEWKGDVFEIMYVQDWTDMGVLEHYKGIAVRKEISK